MDYLVAFAVVEKTWPHKQIPPWEPQRVYPLLRRAAVKYGDERCAEGAQAMPNIETEAGRDHLRYPTIEYPGTAEREHGIKRRP